MADVDVEMTGPDGAVDVTQALADQLQQQAEVSRPRNNNSSVLARDTTWRCAHIELVGHRTEQQQQQGAVAHFPRIQSGIWRINTTPQGLGAQVLLTEHNADPARCYYRRSSDVDAAGSSLPTQPPPLQQQPLAHPHLLNLYGARGTMYVCEDGWPFAEFVGMSGGHKCVLRVFYDVLVGMQFIHDLGFTHGSVNAEHIVVGVNNKGKLLTHFANFGNQMGGEPEPEDKMFVDEEEEETKESELKERRAAAAAEPSDFQIQFRNDEREFVKCMESSIIVLIKVLSKRTDDPEEAKLKNFMELLNETLALLGRVLYGEVSADGSQRRPPLRMTRAALELKKLAEKESEIFGTVVPVAAQ